MSVASHPRILIADDHAPSRVAIRHILEAAGLHICAEAEDATAAIEAAEATRPDLALLGVDIPGGGIRAAAAITSSELATRVVMLTVKPNDADLFKSLSVGASGYLVKDMDLARLPIALRGVLAGEAALSRQLAAHLITEFRARDRRRLLGDLGHRGELLTTREWDVLELLERDLTTEQIADRLFVAKVTVRTHIAAILHKLEAADRTEAIRVFRTST